jgi:DNA-binding IclR family transcriptional regulator
MPAGSTARVVAVLDALVRAPDSTVGVRELAGQLMLSRSATHRILVLLSEVGVARPVDGRYQITARARAWAYYLSVQHPLLVRTRPIMAELADRAGENVHLLVRTPNPSLGIFIASAEGANRVQRALQRGVLTPLTVGAAGKALLSAVDQDTVTTVLRSLALTDPQRAASLRAELAQIRSAGIAVSVSERLAETAGVAAPFWRFGAAFGALTISTPAYRFDDERSALFSKMVRAAAEQLSECLAADTVEQPVASG